MKDKNLNEKIEHYQRTCATVDLDAIVENMRNMKRNIAEETKLIGVIKTDGYGHGSVPIARCLEQEDFMYGFATATVEEAHILRSAGITKPILILGYTFPYCYEMLVREEIRPAVFRYDTIPELAEAARKLGRKVKVHIKVDTGMGRIGVSPDEEGLSFVRELMKQEEIIVEGIFTHFARADEKDKTAACEQLRKFQNFIQMIEEQLGLKILVKHCANSASILELPQTCMDVMRAGITMYGLYPSEEVGRECDPLKPALSWYSQIVYCKVLHKGQSVSYGGLFTAPCDMRIATIPVGYGDGYARSLSGKGYVLIRGRRAPICGRICMDQFMVDVTDIPGVKEKDVVTLLGRDGEETITMEELGNLSGRFNYEFACLITPRVPRIFHS